MTGNTERSRTYYDEFSKRYEDERGDNAPGGYHDLLDTLESDYVRKFGAGKDVLEVGCGTGLVLERIATFAKSARGIDLSPGMLQKARERGLDVQEASATDLPFSDASFDVTCSFKVLAHIPEIEKALSEMARVTRPGGVVLAELYNPNSVRGLLRRFGPARVVGHETRESDVFTRFDTPEQAQALTPRGCTFEGARGVRIVTPTAGMMKVPVLGRVLWQAEHALCDGPLRNFAGFYVAAYRKA